MAFTTTLNASEASNCNERITKVSDTFCEQIIRKEALEIDWGVFNSALTLKEGFSKKQNPKEIIVAELSLRNKKDSLNSISKNHFGLKSYEWPKPKILDRSFEAAVGSLDLDGKRDVRYCTLYEIDNIVQLPDSLPHYQLDALTHFSNAFLGTISATEFHSTSNLNSKLCSHLLRLVSGST